MLYSKFIFDAEQKTINQFDNGTWYLEPEWKDIVCREVTDNIEDIEDGYISDWWDVENILRLEVERRNAQDNKKKTVVDWLYDLINQKIDPVMLEEENDLIGNVVEYMKVNHDLQNQDK